MTLISLHFATGPGLWWDQRNALRSVVLYLWLVPKKHTLHKRLWNGWMHKQLRYSLVWGQMRNWNSVAVSGFSRGHPPLDSHRTAIRTQGPLSLSVSALLLLQGSCYDSGQPAIHLSNQHSLSAYGMPGALSSPFSLFLFLPASPFPSFLFFRQSSAAEHLWGKSWKIQGQDY